MSLRKLSRFTFAHLTEAFMRVVRHLHGTSRTNEAKKCEKTGNEATTLLKTKEVDLERTQTRSHESQVFNHWLLAIMNKTKHMYVVGFAVKPLSCLESIYCKTFAPQVQNWITSRSQKTEDMRQKARLTNEAGMSFGMSEITSAAPAPSPELGFDPSALRIPSSASARRQMEILRRLRASNPDSEVATGIGSETGVWARRTPAPVAGSRFNLGEDINYCKDNVVITIPKLGQ
jgi:hypothetical protein